MKAISVSFNIINIGEYNQKFVEEKIFEIFKDACLTGTKIKTRPVSFQTSSGKKLIRKFLKKRDGDLCYWCKKPIDFNAKPEDDMSVTIEHLKRKCEGGSNELDNLALAHKICNNERHHK